VSWCPAALRAESQYEAPPLHLLHTFRLVFCVKGLKKAFLDYLHVVSFIQRRSTGLGYQSRFGRSHIFFSDKMEDAQSSNQSEARPQAPESKEINQATTAGWVGLLVALVLGIVTFILGIVAITGGQWSKITEVSFISRKNCKFPIFRVGRHLTLVSEMTH